MQPTQTQPIESQETSRAAAWRQAVVYQVYPWTFYEDAGRQPQLGHGSIRGITEKLPYLQDDLGIDAVWLSPFYPSAMKDGGYDITDYKNVHPELGTLEDFDALVGAVHARGLKIMIDFVPNHTSDQHDWFAKSRAKEDGYEDWYIWHPGKTDDQGNRRPPNNWASVFSIPNRKARDSGEMPEVGPDDFTPPVSAWQWDDERGEYYLRTFAKEQPDLNWSNPNVREAMKDVMRWWLDRGVDGFRVDTVNHLGKNMDFTDEQVNAAYNEKEFENPYDQLLKYNSCGFPDTLHQYVWEMAEVLRDEPYERRDLRMILEAYTGEAELRDINKIASDVASTFNFGAMRLAWDANRRKLQLDYYYQNFDPHGVPNQVNGNHDNPRLATLRGDAIARAAAVLNLFLPGMRFIYNGEELGLHDADIPLERRQDQRNGLRDGARTPIIWDDEQPNAGFSRADPANLWLPVNDADLGLSVAKELDDPHSSLTLYTKAIRLSRELPAIASGRYVPLKTDNEWVLAFGRSAGDDKAIVVVNCSPYVQHTELLGNDFASAKAVLSSVDITENLRNINLEAGVHLQPNEALVVVPNTERFALWG